MEETERMIMEGINRSESRLSVDSDDRDEQPWLLQAVSRAGVAANGRGATLGEAAAQMLELLDDGKAP